MSSTYSPCPSCHKLNRVDLSQSSAKEPICGSCKTPLHLHFGISEVSGTGLKVLAEKSPLPVICDFWASWCGPCKSFAPVFQQAVHRFAGRVAFAKLNTEQHAIAGDTYRVRSIPTLILFHKGLEKTRISGALPLEDFSQWLESNISQP